jgi:ATP-binding cassette subfamily B protein
LADNSLTSFLESVSIFSAFNAQDIAELAEMAETRYFNFGDPVCNAGEPSDGLYVIRSGTVRIFTLEQGKEVSMGVRKEGAVFSEAGLLGAFPH